MMTQTLSSVPSTTSIQSQKNRTFLGIDSILYPKEAKPQANQKKTRRGAVMDSSTNAAKDPKKQYLEVEALRGFGKSGARISSIMNEMQAKKLLEKTQSSTVTRESTSAHRGEKK